MHRANRSQGFSLIELVAVLAILAILAGVLVPRVGNHMAAARDARRLADVKAVRAAIEQHYRDEGRYPKGDQSASYGGWDVSHDRRFVRELRDKGYLEEDAADPVNDDAYHYRYYVYSAGSYGCAGNSDFYVLAIKNFESPDFARKNKGYFRCKERDWGAEFAYVTGGGVSFGR